MKSVSRKLILFLGIWLAPVILFAQQTGQTVNTEDPVITVDTVIRAIPNAEIVTEIEILSELILTIGNYVNSERLVGININIQSLISQIDTQLSQIDTSLIESINNRTLSSKQTILNRLQSEMKSGLETLKTVSSDLDGFKTELKSKLNKWELTNIEKDEDITETLISNINDAISAIGIANQELSDTIKSVLDLQSAAGSRILQNNEILLQIEEIKGSQMKRIFIKDSPYIWQDSRDETDTVSFAGQIFITFKTGFDEIISYYKNNTRQNPIVPLVSVVLIVLLMIILKIKKDKWLTFDDDLKISQYLISRPFVTGVLLFLLITLLGNPNRPTLVKDFGFMIMMIPLVVLLPRMIDKKLQLVFIVIASLFILDELHNMLIGTGYFKRIIMLVETLLAILGLSLLLSSPGKNLRAISNSWWQFFIKLAPYALFILCISAVTNIYGVVHLAELITEAVIISVTASIILLASAMILQNMFILLLHAKIFQASIIIKRNYLSFKKSFTSGVYGAAVIWWMIVTLRRFQVWDPAYEWFTNGINYKWDFGTVDVSIFDILIFFITVIASYFISKFLRSVLEEEIFPRTNINPGIGTATSMLFRYTLMLIGFFLAVAAAGLDLSTFSMIAGALSVGIGFGLQNVVSNFVSGLILAFERPIQIGDTVEVDQLLGKVREIGIRSSKIKTFDGAEVIVPNEEFISKKVINWTHTDTLRRISIEFSVEYGTDPNKVLKILSETAGNHEQVLGMPQPMGLFKGYGNNSLDFELLLWTKDSILEVRSEVTLAIHNTLSEEGIKIPYPKHNIILDSDSKKLK